MREKMKSGKNKVERGSVFTFFLERVIYIRRLVSSEFATYETIIAGSRSSTEYYMLLIFSCIIALFGLYENSPAVIIGAMIVAPLIGPIMGFSAGVLWGDIKNIFGAILTLIKGVVLVLIITTVLSYLLPGLAVNSEISSRAHPGFYDLVIAIACGAIGAYGAINKKVSGSLTGIAISVALLPPLCTVGIGMGLVQPEIITGAALLFAINLLGISFGSIFIFYIAGLHPGSFDKEEISHVQKRALGQILLSLLFFAGICVVIFYFSISSVEKIRTREKVNTILVGHLENNKIFSLELEDTGKSIIINGILLRADNNKYPDKTAIEMELSAAMNKHVILNLYYIESQINKDLAD
jgi:uncharacterized hydrophobic protein (TIGR00271 family)